MLLFQSTYFDYHEELKDGFFEFFADTWNDAVSKAQGKCYKNDKDGLKSLTLVGKTTQQIVRFQ